VLPSVPVIQASGLWKRFGSYDAVRGVDITVQSGECVGLLGPNGAGKTSIVRMIYGLSPISAGRLEVFGEAISSHARSIKARIGVVAQEDNLDPVLTVRENLEVYAGYFRLPAAEARKRAEEILAFMELEEKAEDTVENLSGGMKRRLAVGRGLINQPHLLLLDEPTTGLDPFARHLVWQRLRRLKAAGTTMLLTTHYMEEASQLCDRLIILHQGEIVEEGSPRGLVRQHAGKEAVELGIAAKELPALLQPVAAQVRGHQRFGDDVVLFTDHGLELMDAVCRESAVRGIELRYRQLRQANLEDVFLRLTGMNLREEQDDSGEAERKGGAE